MDAVFFFRFCSIPRKEFHMTQDSTSTSSRRDFIRKAGAIGTAATFATLGHSGVWAAGSDAPEKQEVKIGFIALTD